MSSFYGVAPLIGLFDLRRIHVVSAGHCAAIHSSLPAFKSHSPGLLVIIAAQTECPLFIRFVCKRHGADDVRRVDWFALAQRRRLARQRLRRERGNSKTM